ncbi:MAG TPA: hypothetical protein VMU01_00795, partial [Rhizomicrobium sp.]|nr:hypothetical protein [Rhizomicrobium sp.]
NLNPPIAALSVVINVIHNVRPKPSVASKPTITNQFRREEWSRNTAYRQRAGCRANPLRLAQRKTLKKLAPLRVYCRWLRGPDLN